MALISFKNFTWTLKAKQCAVIYYFVTINYSLCSNFYGSLLPIKIKLPRTIVPLVWLELLLYVGWVCLK